MRRGTGLPQLFAFGLIMLMAFVLLIAVFFLRSGDAPVTENVDSELADLKAYYVLNGLLNYKISEAVLDEVFEDPRFSDFITYYHSSNNELGFFQQIFLNDPEKVRETNAFQAVVRDSINQTLNDKGLLYKFSLNEELITGNLIKPERENIFNSCDTGMSNVTLVRKDDEIKATLEICEVIR